MWVNRSGLSPKMSAGSELLRSLTKSERPCAIRSHRTEEIRDHERIAQVAHQKWANEWIARFFERITHLLIFGQKTSDSFGRMSKFPALPFLNMHVCEYEMVKTVLFTKKSPWVSSAECEPSQLKGQSNEIRYLLFLLHQWTLKKSDSFASNYS